MGKTNRNYREDYIKSNRKGSRDAELEFENGFVSTHKVHKSKKNFQRKPKHKSQIFKELY
jgi:hypothetical protein